MNILACVRLLVSASFLPLFFLDLLKHLIILGPMVVDVEHCQIRVCGPRQILDIVLDVDAVLGSLRATDVL